MLSRLRLVALLLLQCVALAIASYSQTSLTLRVQDENGLAVPDALVSVQQGNAAARTFRTDYLGRFRVVLPSAAPFSIHVEKPGFYVLNASNIAVTDTAPFVLTHQQQVHEEVNVVGSPPIIDPAQTSDATRMEAPEIVNVPYPTSRDIRNLLPFNPGVVQDPQTVQVHVAGSETWQTQNLLDGFNITSPVSGTLSLRFSPDAIRSVQVESTRYPVEFGKATGGIISFRSGMGDNRFRFNATNFIPSFQSKKGLSFDKFVPRFTFSGPIKRNKAWFYDGLELEYDNVVIRELPNGADSNRPWRGSNLAKVQVNLTPANILTIGGVANVYRSPYEGLSPITPQSSTVHRSITAGIGFLRDQHTFAGGTVIEAGLAGIAFDDSATPHGTLPFQVTPEGTLGSYFETRDGTSRRIQERLDLYVSPQHWAGRHVLKMGVDLDQIHYTQDASFAPVNYLREDGSLVRQSTFPQPANVSGTNHEFGAYLQDAYSPAAKWLIEPGLRFDHDRLSGRSVVSPRLAMTYSFAGDSMTKLSAGIGLYYDHTQLELIERALQPPRLDTAFAADGLTPIGPPVESVFTYAPGGLRLPRALNWSVGVERKMPKQIFLRVNFLQKRTYDQFTFVNSIQSGRSVYSLANSRHDHYHSIEITARRNFTKGYALFASYVRSSATTDAALDYYPTISILGPQGSGPLSWDTPNRLLTWGWLPFPKTRRLDFVYSVDWRTGFPYTSLNASQQLVGTPNASRFPDYLSFNPGLEIRFHLHGTYFGLRGVAENITSHANWYSVYNNVDSPRYGTFTGKEGRSFTARIRIIGSN